MTPATHSLAGGDRAPAMHWGEDSTIARAISSVSARTSSPEDFCMQPPERGHLDKRSQSCSRLAGGSIPRLFSPSSSNSLIRHSNLEPIQHCPQLHMTRRLAVSDYLPGGCGSSLEAPLAFHFRSLSEVRELETPYIRGSMQLQRPS